MIAWLASSVSVNWEKVGDGMMGVWLGGGNVRDVDGLGCSDSGVLVGSWDSMAGLGGGGVDLLVEVSVSAIGSADWKGPYSLSCSSDEYS